MRVVCPKIPEFRLFKVDFVLNALKQRMVAKLQ